MPHLEALSPRLGNRSNTSHWRWRTRMERQRDTLRQFSRLAVSAAALPQRRAQVVVDSALATSRCTCRNCCQGTHCGRLLCCSPCRCCHCFWLRQHSGRSANVGLESSVVVVVVVVVRYRRLVMWWGCLGSPHDSGCRRILILRWDFPSLRQSERNIC